ncbi:MAG: hypothetical protein ACK5RL_08180 [Acidimicrobiales bacterium]
MIVNCNQMWTRLVGAVYRLRGRPVLTSTPPPLGPARSGPAASSSATSELPR